MDRRPVTYLARHGQTLSNVMLRYAGRDPESLTDLGRSQVTQLAKRLITCDIGQIWTSDIVRARESARIVGRLIGAPIRTDVRLSEMLMGPWEGLTESQVAARYPDAYELWQETPHLVELDGRETLDMLLSRVTSVMREAADATRPVLLVTHVAVIRVAILDVFAMPLGGYRSLSIKNADCFVVEHSKKDVHCLGDRDSLRRNLIGAKQ